MTEQEWLACDDPQRMLREVAIQRPPAAISDRKLRLFAAACGRQVWHLLPDERSRRAVEAAEEFADGGLELHALTRAGAEAAAVSPGPGCATYGVIACCLPSAWDAASHTMRWTGEHGEGRDVQCALLRDIVGNPFSPQPKWTNHSVKGVPGGTWSLYGRPSLITPTVLSLAQAAYDERPGRECEKCWGRGGWCHCPGCGGEWAGEVGPDCFACGAPYLTRKSCPECSGTGRIEDGSLDPVRLAILADSLLDAGCEQEELLAHLRSPGPHVRGCWALDLILGLE